MPERAPLSASLAGADWLVRPATQAVLATIEAGGYSARIVGGAVRNALLGTPVRDIDIATTAEPEAVMALARAAGLHAVPTGIAHGTVTVVADHSAYEVTTLREDAETFGRHAKVAFTDDWIADARRRDFTINALYCDAQGQVHDPLGGLPDLRARRVRFIGSPDDRIREDRLRILRFFRFGAEYTPGPPDAEGLAAAIRARTGLAALSGERIRTEMLRLLAAPGAVSSVQIMAETGLLQIVLGLVPRATRLARFAALEAALGSGADAVLRLAAVAIEMPEDAARLATRLRLSNAEAERCGRGAGGARATAAALLAGALPAAIHRAAYRTGKPALGDAVLLAWTRDGLAPDAPAARRVHDGILGWSPPTLPVRGADVLSAGVPPGPAIGRILAAFEDWWVEAGFPSDADVIAHRLAQIAAAERAAS